MHGLLTFCGVLYNNSTMNRQQKGACGELLAAAALVREGYEVFLNPTHHGLADLVASKDGATLLVQVKTFYSKKPRGNAIPSPAAETRTSNTVNGEYHVPYANLVDVLALVDVDSGEVFLLPADFRKCQVSKSQVLEHRIFP